MKKLTVALLVAVVSLSSVSVQAKSSWGKSLLIAGGGALAGYVIGKAMNNDSNDNRIQNQQNQTRSQRYIDEYGNTCILKTQTEVLSNGNIRQVQVKECTR